MTLNPTALILELASLLGALPQSVTTAPESTSAVVDPLAEPEGDDYAWAQDVLARGPRTLVALQISLRDPAPFTVTLAADGKTAILVGGATEIHFVPGARSFSARIVPASGDAATPLRTAIDVTVGRNGTAQVTGGIVWHDRSATNAKIPLPRYRERRAGDRELFTLVVDAKGTLQRAQGYVSVGSDEILAYDTLMKSYVKAIAGTDVCVADQAPIDVKLAPGRPVEPFDVCSRLYEAKLLRSAPVPVTVPALLP